MLFFYLMARKRRYRLVLRSVGVNGFWTLISIQKRFFGRNEFKKGLVHSNNFSSNNEIILPCIKESFKVLKSKNNNLIFSDVSVLSMIFTFFLNKSIGIVKYLKLNLV